MKAIKSICCAVLLTGCAATPDRSLGEAISEVVSGPESTTTEHFTFGDYSSSAWVSDKFTGEKSRRFIGNALNFSVDQSHPEGGLDVGLSLDKPNTDPVSVAIKNLRVCSSYKTELTGEGRWWAGPKISVNWQGDEAAKQNGDDWYENYIIETASSTPDELHDIYTGDYFKGEELPRTKIAGADYRHYKIRFHSWWQFWSVRQDYRTSGIVPIEPIVDIWVANGLPAGRNFDGVKANIETYGSMSGRGTLRFQSSRDPGTALTCE